jgi:hypothetical protein
MGARDEADSKDPGAFAPGSLSTCSYWFNADYRP